MKHIFTAICMAVCGGLSAAPADVNSADAQLVQLVKQVVYGMDNLRTHAADIRELLKRGADPNAVYEGKSLMQLADDISWDMQQAFVRYELSLAGAEVSAEQARQMLEFGAVYGYPEFVERALACGAPADGIVIARYSFACGESLLYTAIDGFECHYDGDGVACARLLLAAGADPNRINSKDALVPLLNYRCTPELLTLLLEHGADPNVTNADGRNALMLRFRYQCPHAAQELVRVLVRGGLNINHRDSYGMTLMDYVLDIERRRQNAQSVHPNEWKELNEIKQLLRSLGAKSAAELEE